MSSQLRTRRHPRFTPGKDFIFSSLVDVPMTGVNWGSKSRPITDLEIGSMINLEITGMDTNRNFVIQPEATKDLWGGRASKLSKIISKHINATQKSENSICGCLLDGSFFAYTPDEEGAAPLRCVLKSRDVKEPVDGLHWSLSRTVDVYFIDFGIAETVPVCRLRYLPEEAAELPAQAAVATWKIPGKKYMWTQEEWDDFVNYTVNLNFKGKVLKMGTDLTTGRLALQLALCSRKTGAVLYPQNKFWEGP